MQFPDPNYPDPELVEYDQQVAHYKGEHEKLMRWRKKRLDTLRQQASVAAWERPTTIHDVESILWAWASSDPKLKEYNAGLEIVERRLNVYATLATNRRLELQGQLLMQFMRSLQPRTTA